MLSNTGISPQYDQHLGVSLPQYQDYLFQVLLNKKQSVVLRPSLPIYKHRFTTW